MGSAKVRLGIAFDGEKQVKTAISNINAQLKTLKSEAEKVQSAFKGQEQSEESLAAQCKSLTQILSAQETKVETLRKAVQQATEHEEKWQTKLNATKSALSNAQAELDRLKSSTNASTDEIEKQENAVEDLQRQLEKQQESCTKANTNTEKWKNTLNKAETELNNTQKKLDDTETELKQYASKADDAADETEDLGDEADKASGKLSNMGVAFGTMIGNLATEAIEAAASALKDFASDTIELGMTFDSSMSNVAALSGATADELETLTEVAKEAGTSTIYSASEAADALGYMALAGWDTEEMAEGLEPVLNLAAAASMDLAEASDIVTDYLTAFGLTAEDSAHFTDVMAYAMANSNTDVTELGEAYKNVAATASSMGYSLEDTTAALMTMANAGVKGGEAGTALNTIMTRLATNTSGCADTLEQYGVEVYDSEGNMNSLSSILIGMSGAFADMTDEQQANIAKTVAGTHQYSALQTVLSGLSEEAEESGTSFQDYTTALEECDGAAQDISDTMQDNLSGDLKVLNSVWEDFQLTLYDTQSGAMRDVVQTISGELIPALGDLVAGTEGAGEEVGEALTDMAKQVGDIVGDVVGLILGEDVGNSVSDMFGVVADALADVFGIVQELSPAVSGIIDMVSNVISEILPPIINLLDTITPLINDIVDFCVRLVNSILPALSSIIDAVADALGPIVDILGLVFDALGYVVDGIGWLVDGFSWLISGCPEVADNFDEVMEASEGVLESVTEQTDAWKEFIDTAEETLSSTFSETEQMQNLKDELDEITDENGKVKEGYEARANYIVNELAEAYGIEIEYIDGVIQGYDELSQSVDEYIQQMRTQSLMEFYSSIMSEYETSLPTIKANLADVTKAIAEQEDVLANTSEGTDEYNEALATLNELEEQRTSLTGQIEAYYEAQIGYSDAYTAAQEGNYEKIEELYQNLSICYDEDGNAYVVSTDDKLSAERAYASYLSDLHDEEVASGNERAAALTQAGKDAASESISTLEEQKEETASLWAEIGDIVDKSFWEQRKTASDGGEEVLDEYTDSVSDGKGEVKGVWKEVQSIMNTVMGDTSGSKKNGTKQVDALTGATSSSTALNKARTAVKLLINSSSAAGQTVAKSGGTTNGNFFVSGLYSALTSSNTKTKIYSGTSTLGSWVADGLSKALEINSPSKVATRIGWRVPEGLAVGIVDKAYLVDEAIDDTVASVVRTANMGIQGISIPPFTASQTNTFTATNADVVVAINALGGLILDAIENSGNTYTVNGVTYDDGSAVNTAVSALVRAAQIERRA